MSKESLSLVIAASFTAGPLDAGFAHWSGQLGIQLDATYAPYGQVYQQLLDPSSLISRNTGGINVVLVQEVTAELSAMVAAAAQRNPAPLLVAAMPGAGAINVDEPNVYVVPVAGWYPVADFADDFAEKIGGVPYTPAYFAALSTAIVRMIEAIRTPRPKVIVADCDNTLWDGTVGEDGVEGVEIGPHRRGIMDFLVAQQRAGRLICLASRNSESDVLAVLGRPDSTLKREHLTAWRIDWNSKAASLSSLAAELDLSLDSFVFLDDSPIECAQVRAGCPEVLTLQLPAQASAAEAFVNNVWPLDITRVTADDQLRTVRYQQERQRRDFQATVPALDEFLAGLELEVEIQPLTAPEWERAAQLTQRTNQFNLNGIRRVATDFATGHWLTVRVADRFGDYGLTGLIGYAAEGQTLKVDALMLSCRVLGRGVEHKVLNYLGTLGPDTIELAFQATERNQPALDFLTQIGGYQIPAAAARHAKPQPSTPALPSTSDSLRSTAPTPPTLAVPARASVGGRALVAHIAGNLTTAADLLSAISQPVLAPSGAVTGAGLAAAGDDGAAVPSPLEGRVMRLWAELLGRMPGKVTDNFFALGGQSLQVVQFMARVRQVFGVELPVDLLFTPAFTVAEVSAVILEQQVGQLDDVSSEALLAEIEALSEAEIDALLAEESGR